MLTGRMFSPSAFFHKQFTESVIGECVVRAVILRRWEWAKGKLGNFKKFIQNSDISHLRKSLFCHSKAWVQPVKLSLGNWRSGDGNSSQG